MVHLPSPAGKRQHGRSRCVTRARGRCGRPDRNPIIENWQTEIKKTQIARYNNSTALPPGISLLYGKIKHFGWQDSGNEKSWVPPSHPADYFSILEMNAVSKENEIDWKNTSMVKWRTPGGLRGWKYSRSSTRKTVPCTDNQKQGTPPFSTMERRCALL